MDSFEFLEILVAWTPLCLRFMCCFMFLSAANDLLHSGHFTFAWSCWCFWCWWWFKKDLGAWCILRLWSLKYALEVVLYLQSAESVQERISCAIRILCYVQFVTSEVLNKSTFALEMFSTVRTQNLFSNVLFVNSLFYYVNVCSCASIETQFHRSVWYFITASEIFLQRQRFKPGFWNFNVASEIFCSVWDMYCRKKTAPPKNAPLSLHDRDRGGVIGLKMSKFSLFLHWPRHSPDIKENFGIRIRLFVFCQKGNIAN